MINRIKDFIESKVRVWKMDKIIKSENIDRDDENEMFQAYCRACK